MRSLRFLTLALMLLGGSILGPTSASAASPGVGNLPQGTQSDASYQSSYASQHVTNVFATTQRTSCYRPEVPFAVNDGPTDGYSGETSCTSALATTGEDIGLSPYASQLGSNPGYPAASPMLVKDHSESDLRVDPTNASHLIGSSKWIVSPEGYNHLLGFYESFDGGKTWSVQGHIPGYEGWTDNTDPVGAFDTYGNYYELILPYQFFYNADGTHNVSINPNREPNPSVAAEEISTAVRPHGATTATDWITTHDGAPDVVALYDSRGNEPDKQWITIDTSASSAHENRVYAMWVDFHARTPAPFVAYSDANPDGTHTSWSAPIALPMGAMHPQGDSYLLPHVTPDGTVWTTLTNFQPKKGFCCASIVLDKSTDGGQTWTTVSTVVSNITPPPLQYANTTFRDGIENTFTVGTQLLNGQYPLYVAWEDYSAGVGNVLLSASDDGGNTWSKPIQVNDNVSASVDELQPNLTVAANGTVSVAFYDRRLSCPAAATSEATNAGLAMDLGNPNYTGVLPPYGATNYCVNASVQFYQSTLTPLGHNVRLTQHSWDPQLNAPHTDCAACSTTFIGDYFGNTTSPTADVSSFVSTYNDGTNPNNQQQQVIATVALP
jgi:hypothetical protein